VKKQFPASAWVFAVYAPATAGNALRKTPGQYRKTPTSEKQEKSIILPHFAAKKASVPKYNP
jgi:hypothetical protein